jgi:hypothetical protein
LFLIKIPPVPSGRDFFIKAGEIALASSYLPLAEEAV